MQLLSSTLGDSDLKFPLPPDTIPAEVLEQARRVRNHASSSANQKVRNPPSSFEATFVRSFVDSANSNASTMGVGDRRQNQRRAENFVDSRGSPIPAIRHSLRSAGQSSASQVVGGSATLGKVPKQKSYDIGGIPATNARFRRLGPGESTSFRVASGNASEAKIVKTNSVRVPLSGGDGNQSGGSVSVESTPNMQRRQKSADLPTAMKQEAWSLSSTDR